MPKCIFHSIRTELLSTVSTVTKRERKGAGGGGVGREARRQTSRQAKS